MKQRFQSATDRRFWDAAWFCWLLALLLRLYFFSGYGLGDDVNDVHTAWGLVLNFRLNPLEAHHYRLLTVLPRTLSFYLFGLSDFTLVLPVLLFSLLTHAAAIVLSDSLFGGKGAFITSLLFLSTPYETLTATQSVPDYSTAFFFTLCALFLVRGLSSAALRPMSLAAVSLLGAVLTKTAGLAPLPLIGLATLVSLRRWREWTAFWVSFGLCIAGVCIADRFYSGCYLRWFYFNNFFDGFNAAGRLLEIWAIFPRYLFYRDEFGNLMFGSSGIIFACGVVLSIVRLLQGQRRAAEWLVLACGLFFLLFNFMPHKLTFAGYFTHTRIFRYMAVIVPGVYLSATYFICELLATHSKRRIEIGALVLLTVVVVNLFEIPPVTYPSRDFGHEGRAMDQLVASQLDQPGLDVYADQWKCMRLSAFVRPERRGYQLHCLTATGVEAQRAELDQIQHGLVLTGGGAMPWYGNPLKNFNISELGPRTDNWKLLFEYPMPVTGWRTEPLRIWKVG